MQVFHTKSKIIITCNKRLAPYLQAEVEALGFTPDRVFSTGLELTGTVTDCIKLNLNLRCASQVLYSLKILLIKLIPVIAPAVIKPENNAAPTPAVTIS